MSAERKRQTIDRALHSVRDVTLTRAEADSICETLIAMAVRLPMRYRNHAEALDMLDYRPPASAPPAVSPEKR